MPLIKILHCINMITRVNNTRVTFLDLYLQNKVRLEDIDDYVDIWHTDISIGKSLHEYLGMSWEEYAGYVEGTLIERIIK